MGCCGSDCSCGSEGMGDGGGGAPSSSISRSSCSTRSITKSPINGAGNDSADIVMDRSNGRSKSVSFIEMPWQAHAVAAIQGLDGTDLKGRSINVSRARPRSDGGSRGNPPRGWDVVGDGRNRW